MGAEQARSYGTILLIMTFATYGCGNSPVRNTLAPTGSPSAVVPATAASQADVVIPFDPANFPGTVQNPYFPLVPGTIYTYRQETPEGVEINTVEVTRHTKTILGVQTTIVHDQVLLNGALSEDTFDWEALDKNGNVWYFGEDTRTLGPPVSTTGSWEAGVNGAQPGVIMLAHPSIGDTYLQENAPGVVADQARVKSLNETITVPYGTFTNCLKTQEWTPIEPGSRAFKYYARGIGTIEEDENHNGGPVVLTDFHTP